MDAILCPHCKAQRLPTSRLPREVVVVMPCPACHELAVMFRRKVIAISRQILETGSREERTAHFAEVITEFLESGVLPEALGRLSRESGLGNDASSQETGADGDEDAPEWSPPAPERPGEDRGEITDEEFEKFVRLELKCLDNPTYFRRHFRGKH